MWSCIDVVEEIDAASLSAAARFLVEVTYRSTYNTEVADLSLLFVLQQEAASTSSLAASEATRIAGGNNQLPWLLAMALGAALRLSSPVRSLAQGDAGVRVEIEGEKKLGPIFAAHVVLAVPPAPLRSIRFEPALSSGVAGAYAELNLGAAAKVLHEFSERFWLTRNESGAIVTDLPFGIAWSPTDSYGTPTDPGSSSRRGRKCVDL